MSKIPYITTVDNPYSPATEFKQWWDWDQTHGYGTLELFARLYTGGENQSPADNMIARELAIDEMVKYNVTGKFRKVHYDE